MEKKETERRGRCKMELSHLRSRRLESGIVGISMQNRKMKKKKKGQKKE